ncbi:hypothetical protein [Rhodococcus sp. NPDC058521]|uniref:hypothetical protein n=1 Tax=Rhodococcus sp. NPDC058521 TaxID=3346536 RepID=UPI00365BF30F
MRTLTRGMAGAAVAALATAGIAMAAPATASAAEATQAPGVVVKADGNVLNLTVTNPNSGILNPSCGAYVFDALEIPAVLQNPTAILEPGFAAWGTINPLDRVPANPEGTSSREYTTPELADGVYAVVGECTSVLAPLDPATTFPPQIIFVGGPLGGIGTGSAG